MATRLAAFALLALLLTAGSAAGSSAVDRQRQIEDKIERLRDKIAEADQREDVLSSEIASVTSKIRALEDDVHQANARLDTLENELAVHRNKLATLTQIFELQTEKFRLLKRQFAVAERRLHARLVAIYQQEDPTTVEVVLSARSFTDMLDQLDYVASVGEQDLSIARQVAAAREDVRQARRKTDRLRADVARTAEQVEVRVNAQLAERNRLVSAQDQLATARQSKQRTLSRVQASKEDYLHEVAGLEQTSRELAARIQAAQSASTRHAMPSGAVSAQGFAWPVSGVVTSTFGWRWGRMHEGIDIAAPSGAPIVASASGTVIFSGWMGGYGQLVVVDHGGGIATAYAHMSSIATGVGAVVGQGHVLGYVGCTGHCYGSHLHFEIRVNGAAVDPLGYL